MHRVADWLLAGLLRLQDPKLLFCHLTKTPLNKIPEEIETHVSGKRFKLRLKKREEAAAKGEVEDTLLAGKRAEVCV